METQKPKRKLLIAGPVFKLCLFVIVFTIAATWLSGLKQDSTVFHNAIRSAGLLSPAFFLFLSTALYRGVKLKDDLGKITEKISWKKAPDFNFGFELPDFGDGIPGIIAGIFLAIIAIVLLGVLCFVLWALFLFVVALLYRIFFRGLRFVFRHRNRCKGRWQSSMGYGLGYTALLSCSIYIIIFALHYLVS